MSQVIRLAGQAQRDLAKRLIDSAPPFATVKIEPEKRTTEQSAKMWAMLSDISRAKPLGRSASTDIWKCLFMASIGYKMRFEPALDGDGVIALGYRSSRMSKADMSDMIEAMYAYGSVHGVQWSEQG